MGFNQQKEKSFREIVLSAVETINRILSEELRLRKSFMNIGENTNPISIIEEDTRISFIQSVQALALILNPYFDKQMKEAYGDFDELCDYFDAEFYNNYKEKIDKIMEEEQKAFGKTYELGKTEIRKIFIIEKIRRSKIIFKELNLLLKRQNYLASEIYGEQDDSVIEDDSEEDKLA